MNQHMTPPKKNTKSDFNQPKMLVSYQPANQPTNRGEFTACNA